ncbi:MAG: ABC transporter ATP-binding protein [Candidatus Eremiobacteraeota bacterium]|nr:ABC transporter ATP-binding protein [Candidatus Eremiobacteraeota bacterium]
MAPASQRGIEFQGVSKRYDGGAQAVRDVELAVATGEFVVLLGPSGCGKTTLLKMVNRLQEPSAGRVLVNGVDTHSIPAETLRRGIGYVIQQIGLFPHMSVGQNVAVVPELLGWDAARTAARAHELLDLVGLPRAEFAGRFPGQLSGGQQQRVGLARALGADPAVLLMDEPFGALDAIERLRLQTELADLQRHLCKTILFVTHDVDEALRLADRIVIMREGRVLQAASPLQILAAPADAFVAELLNTHDVIRRMSVLTVADAMRAPADHADEPLGERGPQTRVGLRMDLRSALSLLVLAGEDRALVVDGGQVAGQASITDMLRAARMLPSSTSA